MRAPALRRRCRRFVRVGAARLRRPPPAANRAGAWSPQVGAVAAPPSHQASHLAAEAVRAWSTVLVGIFHKSRMAAMTPAIAERFCFASSSVAWDCWMQAPGPRTENCKLLFRADVRCAGDVREERNLVPQQPVELFRRRGARL